MGFLQWLEDVISHIQRKRADHETIGQTVRNLPPSLNISGGGEALLRVPMERHALNGKMGGVDSGFVSQSFYALDLMLLRVMGVCFTYENGKVVQSKYFPEIPGMPQPIVDTKGLEQEEFRKFVSLTRVQGEMNRAREMIEEFGLEVCFLDGSMILHPSDKPNSDSKLWNEYQKTIRACIELYKAAESKNCLLIGAIEDSRSTRLSELLHQQFPNHPIISKGLGKEMQDAPLLDKVLQAGERSMAFTIAGDAKKHPILMDFPEEWARKLYACYVKPSQWDYPLRIEFLGNEKDITEKTNRAASIAFAQSGLHKEYAYPAVLIEADLRAGLKPEEIGLVSDKIFSKLGRHTIHLRRRDRRPF